MRPTYTEVKEVTDLAVRPSSNKDVEVLPLCYTPATCAPDDFTKKNGYTLQAAKSDQPTELLIGITYYNESRSFLSNTLQAVLDNIRYIMDNSADSWGPRHSVPSKIVVCLLLDGFEHCDAEVLELMKALGIFQKGIMRSEVFGSMTKAHIFERTSWLTSTDLSTDDTNTVHEKPTPVQFLVCLKEQNSKKINSHRWLFNAFGKMLDPKVCVLLDAGTRPRPSALYKMWKAFESDSNLGGACGQLCVDLGPRSKYLLNPLVAMQNFEYKMSHIMDKSLESCAGYISVLPGAFSAYRHEAIQGQPLRCYFQGDHSSGEPDQCTTVFYKNMFLAEDRVLGFEIVAKADASWHLGYCRDCHADTDVPQDIVELLGQRRRWLNGAFAVFIYSILQSPRLLRTKHSAFRLTALFSLLCYNVMGSLVAWFAPTILFLVVVVIIKAQTDIWNQVSDTSTTSDSSFAAFNDDLLGFYGCFLMFQVVLALGSRPTDVRMLNILSTIVFCLFSAYILALSIYSTQSMFQIFAGAESQSSQKELFNNSSSTCAIVAYAILVGAPIICSLCHLSAWHIITSWLQYMLFAPCFVNVLMLHAFCNWHDVSWGTKGSDHEDSNTHELVARSHQSANATPNGSWDIEEQQLPSQQATRTLTARLLKLKRLSSSSPASHRSSRAKARASNDSPDGYRKLRTYLLLVWVASNLAVAMGLGTWNRENALKASEIEALRIVVWVCVGITSIRMSGSLLFLLIH